MGLCPRVYSDDELLLLLTVVAKVGLDSRLLLTSSTELYPLQYKIVNNVRDWDTMVSDNGSSQWCHCNAEHQTKLFECVQQNV